MELGQRMNIIEAIKMPVGTEFEIIQTDCGRNNTRIVVGQCGTKKTLFCKETTDLLQTLEKNILADFILVKKVDKKVDFMDAVKACINGKVIYCKVDGEKYTYKPLERSDSILKDLDCCGLSAKEILEGDWYIKGEEKNMHKIA